MIPEAREAGRNSTSALGAHTPIDPPRLLLGARPTSVSIFGSLWMHCAAHICYCPCCLDAVWMLSRTNPSRGVVAVCYYMKISERSLATPRSSHSLSLHAGQLWLDLSAETTTLAAGNVGHCKNRRMTAHPSDNTSRHCNHSVSHRQFASCDLPI